MNYLNVDVIDDRIFHKYVTESGVRRMEFIPFEMKIYEETTGSASFHSYPERVPLREKKLSISDFSTMKKQNRETELKYNWIEPKYQFLIEKYRGAIDPTASLKFSRKVFIDIEVDTPGEFPDAVDAKFPIIAIAVFDSLQNNYTVFGIHDQIVSSEYKFVSCSSEKELLQKFISFWRSADFPDLVVGWNSDRFDIPYIVARISQLIPSMKNDLSPIQKVFSRVKRGTKETFFQDAVVSTIGGVSLVDLMVFYKKFVTEPIVDHKLSTVGMKETGITKVEFDGTLYDLYRNDPQKFFDYNFRDVQLLVKINERRKLLEIVMIWAYVCHVLFDDVSSPVKSWNIKMISDKLYPERLIMNTSRKNIIETLKGADVRDTKIGIHRWIISADVSSMYPNLIRSLNMGNETIREFDSTEHCCSATGHYFDKSKESFISKMIGEIYNERMMIKQRIKQLESKNDK